MTKLAICMAVLTLTCVGCVSYAHKAMRADAVPVQEAPLPYAPAETEEPGLQIQPAFADIWLDCGTNQLGAYSLEVRYDPSIVTVSGIAALPDAPAGFASQPMSKRETYRSGATGIIGLFPGGTGPSGRVPLARIFFAPVAEGRSVLSVSIKSIYDVDSKLITGVTVLSSNEIVVGR